MFHVFTEASPENFFPKVNEDFAGRPLPSPPRRRDLEKFRALALL